ncbi:MAG: 4'-phosphopantetheinyl transferase family protein [Solirubrobacteraceae bacterium]
MIERLLPAEVASAEARDDVLEESPYPEEQALVGNAVAKRRREFLSARACARRALVSLGLPAQPIASGEHGEPLWPSGVAGSITHCDGYRACALARAPAVIALGIDAEPNASLPAGVLEAIVRPEEEPMLARLHRRAPRVHWDRLLFSAKESVYKAWFPLAHRPLGFEDAILRIELAEEDPCGRYGHSAPQTREPHPAGGSAHGSFSARLLVDGVRFEETTLTSFSGTWLARDGLLLTAVAARNPRGGKTFG